MAARAHRVLGLAEVLDEGGVVRAGQEVAQLEGLQGPAAALGGAIDEETPRPHLL